MIYIKIENSRQYVPGVYIIKSSCGKIYVGSAIQLRTRFMSHRKMLQDNKHHNKRLQNHYNKYGSDSLTFETIETCHKDLLIEREQYYIDTLNPSFNICRIAGATYGLKPWLGRKHSEETKRKIKQANLNTFSIRPKKIKPVKLTREQNIQRFADLNRSPEGRKRCSDLHKGNTHWLGKKHNPETIANRIGSLNPNSSSIICKDFNLKFDTVNEAAAYFKVGKSAICNSITRGNKVLKTYALSYGND